MAGVRTESIFSWRSALYFLLAVIAVFSSFLLEALGVPGILAFGVAMGLLLGLMALVDGGNKKSRVRLLRRSRVIWAIYNGLSIFGLIFLIWVIIKIMSFILSDPPGLAGGTFRNVLQIYSSPHKTDRP